MQNGKTLIPTILSGGAGSRLWPVSRELHPKPFIRLPDGQSLLQKAFLRSAALPGVKEVLTVTNRELFFKTEDEYRKVNATNLATSYILEPFGRNTAPAIAAAALYASKAFGDDAILLVLTADHLISDQEGFTTAVIEAKKLAETGRLVTFGIHPDAPETGYGYIEAEGNSVLRFIEKPTLDKAREYLEAGNFLWNSGMFCFKAGAVLQQMERHSPEIYAATRDCMAKSRAAEGKGLVQLELDADSFAKVPDNSIDYAVMEKVAAAQFRNSTPSPTGRGLVKGGEADSNTEPSVTLAVIPCHIGWSDIGSWRALGEIAQADDQGNRIEGDALLHDATNCYIRSEDRIVGVVGVDNLIIVDTLDALLVADKDHAQDVKHLYTTLKKSGHDAHKLHRKVNRPWGAYTVLEEGSRFKIKRIEVKPGASLSLQMHHHRCEHWIVVSGMARVVNDKSEFFIATNESTYIPAGHSHRLVNPGVLDLVMIEVQSGEYLGEDDIVRFEDHYGRA
ncbi:MAG: cupin domain-containing protein [Gammaproteobacteria bacterium]|nr:cupin domain-containing protein [Gammaproteobacteria bacterium]MBU1654557.1 cupin domain-containing protein [Gammaproteobacteria bacterium]MBU1961949.1 cupin domain-containing protein [Gammaproteobacteria bacterium]